MRLVTGALRGDGFADASGAVVEAAARVCRFGRVAVACSAGFLAAAARVAGIGAAFFVSVWTSAVPPLATCVTFLGDKGEALGAGGSTTIAAVFLVGLTAGVVVVVEVFFAVPRRRGFLRRAS